MKKNSLLQEEYTLKYSGLKIVAYTLIKVLAVAILIVVMINPTVNSFIMEEIYNQIDINETTFWIKGSLIALPFVVVIGICIGLIKLNVYSLLNNRKK